MRLVGITKGRSAGRVRGVFSPGRLCSLHKNNISRVPVSLCFVVDGKTRSANRAFSSRLTRFFIAFSANKVFNRFRDCPIRYNTDTTVIFLCIAPLFESSQFTNTPLQLSHPYEYDSDRDPCDGYFDCNGSLLRLWNNSSIYNIAEIQDFVNEKDVQIVPVHLPTSLSRGGRYNRGGVETTPVKMQFSLTFNSPPVPAMGTSFQGWGDLKGNHEV